MTALLKYYQLSFLRYISTRRVTGISKLLVVYMFSLFGEPMDHELTKHERAARIIHKRSTRDIPIIMCPSYKRKTEGGSRRTFCHLVLP